MNLVILGYGEDSLTLWAITSQLGEVLSQLSDDQPPDQCAVLYRPSFGRKGGERSSEFGEFDFIILTSRRAYLGESKWDRQGRESLESIQLNTAQTNRHRTMRQYIETWYSGECKSWDEFAEKARSSSRVTQGLKPIPGAKTILYGNLRSTFNQVKSHCSGLPGVVDVLLFFHKGVRDPTTLPTVPLGFQQIHLDYSPLLEETYLRLGCGVTILGKGETEYNSSRDLA